MRRALLVAVLAAVLSVTACSEIPTSGTVQPGTTEAPNGTSIVYLPNPPAAGAKPSEIVSGFLTAASGGGAFKVAKEYLTSGFATKWNPNSGVLVQEAQTTLTSGGAADIRVDVPISAQVDANGVYTPKSGSRPLPFHLVQERGQWRIDSAPNGIVLSQTVFQRNYVPVALQFFDPTWHSLVPDWRWFPTTKTSGSSGPSARSIVDGLTAGPAGALAGGVTANALAGASARTIDEAPDATTVILDVRGGDPSPTVTARMQQQLVQSLPTPSLRLLVNGSLVQPAKVPTPQTVSPLPYVVTGGRFGTLAASGAFTEEPVLGKRIAALKPLAVTFSQHQKLAAVQAVDGDVVIVSPGGQRVVDTRANPTSTLDQRGWVYSVPERATDGLQAADAKGRIVPLGVDLGGATVTAIQASPDGTRLLVLVQGATSGPRASVYGILREPDGTPTGLSSVHYPVDLGGNIGQGIDATWVDDGDVAVLVRSTDESTARVRLQQLGALGSSLGELPNAAQIVGSTSKDSVRVRLQTGDIWVQRSGLWQSESASPVDVSVLAVQR